MCGEGETTPDGEAPHELSVDTGGGRLDAVAPTADRPLVTAVVTTYDRAEEAKRAIRSVRTQTYTPLELVVVEDGADSGVHEWLAASGYDDLRYVRHAENQGLSGARNTAIALSNGRYVAFLDDDDEWKPERVERCVDRFRSLPEHEHERVGVTYCAVESRERGEVVSIVPPENEGPLREAIRRDGPSTLQSASLFDREALVAVGGFDERLRSSVDHDLWLSLAAAGYAARTVAEPLVVSYDDFADSMMTDTENRLIGVAQFVEKWAPTYREWFGPREGERRIRRYHARVLARLVAAKAVTGAFDEAARAGRVAVGASDEYGYTAGVLAVSLVEAAVKRWLPPTVVRRLARLRHRLD